jgi:hypothetical protein
MSIPMQKIYKNGAIRKPDSVLGSDLSTPEHYCLRFAEQIYKKQVH